MFQHYALFRHMSVFENVAFGLRVRRRRDRPSGAPIAERAHRLLELVQLDGLAGRYPSQLSGGQRQRVALARALAVEPKVLLLDEPFGALDARVRKELRRWLRRFHDEIHLTTIFVTHDQEEALEIADEVVVMNQARSSRSARPSRSTLPHQRDRQLARIVIRIECLLRSPAIDYLAEISVLIEQADPDHRHAEIARGFKLIARHIAQSA